MKILYATVLNVSLLWLIACNKYEQQADLTGPLLGEKVEMTFGVSIAGMESPVKIIPINNMNKGNAGDTPIVVTMEEASVDALTRAELDPIANEGLLDGLWVIQFDNAKKLVKCDYHSSSEISDGELSVALYEADETTVYFVGNVDNGKFSDLRLNTTTLDEFEAKALDFVDEEAVTNSGKNLPVVGKYEGSTSVSINKKADIQLRRMVAKLVFTCKIDLDLPGESFSLKTLQLKNVANKASYIDQDVPTGSTTAGMASGYPAAIPGNFMNYDIIDVSALSGSTDMEKTGITQVWYLPENLRGVVAGLSEREKALEYSTYIELTGDYRTQSRESFEVVYRIYPGQNSSTDFNIIRNHQYTIGSTIKGINENDVRVEVNKGEDLSLSGTANCYIVHAAGTTYKFNARVKGNRKDTPAYNSVNQSAPAIDGSEKLSPVSAKVIWETGSKEQVIKDGSIKVDKGYVYFTTAGDKGGTVEEGNALIGVFNDSGTLLWSWHIWATRYDPETDYDTYETRALTASGNIAQTSQRSYTVMKYNLGADATSAEGTAGCFGLLYQWGRKDPFVGARTVSSKGEDYAVTYNDPNYTWDNQKKEVVSPATAEASIAYAIQHPTVFLYDSAPEVTLADWLNVREYAEQRDNLWGNPNTELTRPNQDRGNKSIYDPCPVGWRVAPQDTWTRFAIDGIGTGYNQLNVYGDFDHGWNFYIDASNSKTAFYPAAVFRSSGDGKLSGQSVWGVWSSSSYMGGSYNGGCLCFNGSTSALPLYARARANGFSVRCVKE